MEWSFLLKTDLEKVRLNVAITMSPKCEESKNENEMPHQIYCYIILDVLFF